MPQAVWVTTAVALSAPASPMARSNAIGWVLADERQVALHVEPAATGLGLHPGRAERDVLTHEDLVVDRLVDVRHVVVAESLHPAGALDHAKRRRVGGELHARVGRVLPDHELRLPGGDVDQEVVSGLRRGAGPLSTHGELGVVGPEPMSARLDRHAPSIYRATLTKGDEPNGR